MNKPYIYVVQTNKQMNLLNTFNFHIKNSINLSSSGYTYMSKDIKFDDSLSLESTLLNDLKAHSLTSCHKKYIEKKLSQINSIDLFDIYDLIPDFSKSYIELNLDQKFAFKLLRLLMQNNKTLILQEQSSSISTKLFLKTKKLFTHLNKENGYTIIVESQNFQNWSDTCDNYIRFEKSKISITQNKLKNENYEHLENQDLYQIAL